MATLKLSRRLMAAGIAMTFASPAVAQAKEMNHGAHTAAKAPAMTDMGSREMSGMDSREMTETGSHKMDMGVHNMNNREHSLHLAARQTMLTQKISKEFVLVALGIDPEQNAASLRQSREQFDRVLKGLRQGDDGLYLAPMDAPEVLRRLGELERVWPSFDAVLAQIATTHQIAQHDVSAALDFDPKLLETATRAVDAYERKVSEGRTHSILVFATKHSERLGMLSQKLAKEFLLIAYGYRVEINKMQLQKSIKVVDKILAGLANGDLELKLLPAPNSKIAARIREIQAHWKQIHPMLDAAVAANGPAPTELRKVVSECNGLLAQVEPLIDLYEAL
jgi:hypothetical protein